MVSSALTHSLSFICYVSASSSAQGPYVHDHHVTQSLPVWLPSVISYSAPDSLIARSDQQLATRCLLHEDKLARFCQITIKWRRPVPTGQQRLMVLFGPALEQGCFMWCYASPVSGGLTSAVAFQLTLDIRIQCERSHASFRLPLMRTPITRSREELRTYFLHHLIDSRVISCIR